MELGLSGKVAMIAAASKGIGLATAKSLYAEGCKVSICARSEEILEQAAAEIGEEARSYVVDVSDAEDLAWWVDQTRQDLGYADILVTNTGGPPAGELSALTDAQWQTGVDGTLMNVVRLVRLVAPEMQTRGWGRIVHVTSLVAKEPSPVLPISSTLRAGLIALTRLQATELGATGVTVNSVLPGHTLTDRQRHLLALRAERESISEEEAELKQAAMVALERLADPREIGDVITFLCSERASYVTGTSILVDGGATHGLG
jgi:3-oxoacyl-[acyl-carrier protein] reductase